MPHLQEVQAVVGQVAREVPVNALDVVEQLAEITRPDLGRDTLQMPSRSSPIVVNLLVPARASTPKKSRRNSGSPPVNRSVVTPMSPRRPISATAEISVSWTLVSRGRTERRANRSDTLLASDSRAS